MSTKMARMTLDDVARMIRIIPVLVRLPLGNIFLHVSRNLGPAVSLRYVANFPDFLLENGEL